MLKVNVLGRKIKSLKIYGGEGGGRGAIVKIKCRRVNISHFNRSNQYFALQLGTFTDDPHCRSLRNGENSNIKI